MTTPPFMPLAYFGASPKLAEGQRPVALKGIAMGKSIRESSPALQVNVWHFSAAWYILSQSIGERRPGGPAKDDVRKEDPV